MINFPTIVDLNLNAITMFCGVISLIMMSGLSNRKFSTASSIAMITAAVVLFVFYIIRMWYIMPDEQYISALFARALTWNIMILCAALIIIAVMSLVWNSRHAKPLSSVLMFTWFIIVIVAFSINNIPIPS